MTQSQAQQALIEHLKAQLAVEKKRNRELENKLMTLQERIRDLFDLSK